MRRIAVLALAFAVLVSVCISPAGAVNADESQASTKTQQTHTQENFGPIVEQNLDYTENPVDIPNPISAIQKITRLPRMYPSDREGTRSPATTTPTSNTGWKT